MTYLPSVKKNVNQKIQQIEVELDIKAENQKLLTDLKELINKTRLNKICIAINKINENEYVVQEIQEPLIES